jgi:UDP-N-acetylglucosamine/UDP-N-acetylgalactosamine 4-epimerase
MAKVLVTGGAGFIGSTVVRKCLDSGHEVVVLDNFSSSSKNELDLLESLGVKAIIGDIRDSESVVNAMQGCDAVVHLAAQSSVPYSFENPQENNSINIEGTQLILNHCNQFNVKRIIIASSAAVYGQVDRLPLKEENAGDLLSPYAESKWENEQQIIASRLNGQYAVALRFFNVYGPGQKADGGYAAVIPKFIDMMIDGKAPTINGDGLHTRDFVHVDDVSKLILTIIEDEWFAVENHVYNVATGNKTSLLDLVASIKKGLESNSINTDNLNPIFGEERVGDIRHSIADIHKISHDYDWEAMITFEQGIISLVEHALDQR